MTTNGRKAERDDGWVVHTYASLPSTQQYIRELIEEDFPEGTVMQALVQTKGKGRNGRIWTSPMGNLYMSVLLRPDCTAAQAGQLSFVAAVALADTIEPLLNKEHKISLKWPNDILVDGKKCAGILLESELDSAGHVKALIMGMGVNIHAPPEDATGLQELSHEITVPVNKFRDDVLTNLHKRYRQWQDKGFTPIRTAWLARAHGIGMSLAAKVGDQEHCGIFRDIDKSGALQLEKDDGSVMSINAGDVHFSQ